MTLIKYMQNIHHHNIHYFFSQQIEDFFIPFVKQSSLNSLFEQKFEDNLSIEFVCDKQLISLNQQTEFIHLDSFKQQKQMQIFQSKQFQIEIQSKNHIKTPIRQTRQDFSDKQLIQQKTSIKRSRKQIKKKKIPKTFYEKNICRNIIRKSIRSIESRIFQTQIKIFCDQQNFDLDQFRQIMVANIQELSGPAALKQFLRPNDQIANIFRKFLVWFLKQRYIREALKDGHMKDINKYIEYKNSIILPMLI